MTTKKITVQKKSILVHEFMDEAQVDQMLEEKGFILENTSWIYSWTPPSWASDSEKAGILSQLEESEYKSYLINVRQETFDE